MIKFVLRLVLCFIPTIVQADAPVGFLWYNHPKDVSLKKPKGVPFSKLSFTDKDAVLRFYTMEALHKVRFTHSMEDERTFLALQDYWLREATFHGALNQATLRHYPEYDFSVTHPTSSMGTQLTQVLMQRKKERLVKRLANTSGLLFFYRGKHPFDQKQIPILKDFCKKYHFSLAAISVDGVRSNEIPNTRFDEGQIKALGVSYFPAVFLLNPTTQTTEPIAYGLTTQDVLLDRLLNAYKGQI